MIDILDSIKDWGGWLVAAILAPLSALYLSHLKARIASRKDHREAAKHKLDITEEAQVRAMNHVDRVNALTERYFGLHQRLDQMRERLNTCEEVERQCQEDRKSDRAEFASRMNEIEARHEKAKRQITHQTQIIADLRRDVERLGASAGMSP